MFEKIKNFFSETSETELEILVSETNELQKISCDGKETILETALAAEIAFPYSCRVGSCGKCKCILEEGKVRNLKSPAFTLSAAEVQENYILACQALPKTNLKITIPKKNTAKS
ncbi:MAG: 2Fe-2S iron-sulfur cluster binding domain-containing protein [Spirochaetota bacterium]